MGLLVDVYRNAGGGSTNGGVSSWTEELCVVNVDGPFEPSEDYHAVELIKGPHGTVNLKPVELVNSGKHCMFGGNYAGTCDSRFGKAVEAFLGHKGVQLVAIHDRVER